MFSLMIRCLLWLWLPSAAAGFLGRTNNDPILRSMSKPFLLSLSSSSADPNELETPEERRLRMDLVRSLQRSFYADDEAGIVEDAGDGLLRNVPLWRVQWTELPGYQNVLHVHVAHYTHMFNRVLSGPGPHLFGHLYLPGGSDNMNNPEYRLGSKESKAVEVGTLMRISDHERLDDGRLVLVVQALSRFRVTEATQHAPYAVATVEIVPDLEEGGEMPSASDRAEEDNRWTPFEIRPTLLGESAEEGGAGAGVSPLANYDASAVPPSTTAAPSSSSSSAAALDLEREVWIAIDETIRLLTALAPSLEVRIPIPTQILGLLPLADPERQPWPDSFRLSEYAELLQRQSGGALVGTASKSPFVRVDEAVADCGGSFYPRRRRARRLSFAVWVLLESLSAGTAPAMTRQQVLEMGSVSERLGAAWAQLRAINDVLRRVLK